MTGIEGLVLTIGKIALVLAAGMGICITFHYFDGDSSSTVSKAKGLRRNDFNR